MDHIGKTIYMYVINNGHVPDLLIIYKIFIWKDLKPGHMYF